MRINYLTWLSKEIGKASDDVDIPETVDNLHELLNFLERLGEGYQRAFKSRNVIFAEIDGEMIKPEQKVAFCSISEMALFTPVVGG